VNKTSVYIVDDHRIVIDGISSFFIGNESFELVGSALSANDLFDDLKKKRPDILILDIKLPGLSGIQICDIITKEYPNIEWSTNSIDKIEHGLKQLVNMKNEEFDVSIYSRKNGLIELLNECKKLMQ